MRPLLAHQGGWDEILLAALLVLAMLGFSRIRRRREARQPAVGPAGVCAYCGAPLESGAPRCAECGFKVPDPA
jgi:MYXO-CTERM domain-containing protein